MSVNELKVYTACLEILKGGLPFNKASLSRVAGLDRKEIYRQIEKHTFQDLEKYKLSS